jgi:hypothetical protein
MGVCRKPLLIFLLFACLAWSAPDTRSVSGLVMDKRGNFLPGSVVEIENSVTKEIQSYIVQKDGRYHFVELNADVEFVLHAQYRGHLSKFWTLSKFSSAKAAKADFVIPIE